STNGTYVNGKKVSSACIHRGDVVEIARQRINWENLFEQPVRQRTQSDLELLSPPSCPIKTRMQAFGAVILFLIAVALVWLFQKYPLKFNTNTKPSSPANNDFAGFTEPSTKLHAFIAVCNQKEPAIQEIATKILQHSSGNQLEVIWNTHQYLRRNWNLVASTNRFEINSIPEILAGGLSGNETEFAIVSYSLFQALHLPSRIRYYKVNGEWHIVNEVCTSYSSSDAITKAFQKHLSTIQEIYTQMDLHCGNWIAIRPQDSYPGQTQLPSAPSVIYYVHEKSYQLHK
ncbi:MAG: FHA domain-containing protein, partial [Bacteroidia bacterium]|nr:FHA domain-containing protein [Bacteroidia bacterium]